MFDRHLEECPEDYDVFYLDETIKNFKECNELINKFEKILELASSGGKYNTGNFPREYDNSLCKELDDAMRHTSDLKRIMKSVLKNPLFKLKA